LIRIPTPDCGTGLLNLITQFGTKKIEADSNAGKLDFLINAGLAEYHQGKTKDL